MLNFLQLFMFSTWRWGGGADKASPIKASQPSESTKHTGTRVGYEIAANF